MSIIQGNALGGTLPEIPNSIRCNGTSSFLAKNFSPSTTTYQKLTLSFWVKRSSLGTNQCIFGGGRVGTGYEGDYLRFNTSDQLEFVYVDSVNGTGPYATSKVFRDTSAWYHLCVAFDTTLTGSDKCKLWVNGESVTVSNGIGSTLYFLYGSAGGLASFGSIEGGTYAGFPFDGYFADCCCVTNLAKQPSDFAYTDSNGQWRTLGKSKLIEQTNLGGSQSFYLPFDNGTSTTTLGYDASSKGNNWTLTNMVRDGSANDCWVPDSPTNNYCVLNAVTDASGGISFGGLRLIAWGANSLYEGSIYVSSGKWYFEMTPASAYTAIGVTKGGADPAANLNPASVGSQAYVVYGATGLKYDSGSSAAYGMTFTSGNVIGVLLDMDVGTVSFTKDNTSFGTAYSGLTGYIAPCYGAPDSYTPGTINFGQQAFAYTPPAGYSTLCTRNLPSPSIPLPKKHFDITTYVGNDGTKTITSIPFSPDLVWLKARNQAYMHGVFDKSRGATNMLTTVNTDAEAPYSTTLTAFTSDGFTLGANSTFNYSAANNVGWMWKAGGTPTTNTAGSITSQVSVNQQAGFSIVTYTGTGANATVGHGLGSTPGMLIIKNRGTAGENWWVWHKGLLSPTTSRILLNTSAAYDSGASSYWNSTVPTSTVFSLGTSIGNNGTSMVAYCISEVPGYSKIGSYTGNASVNGPYVYCGFKPKYVLIKCSQYGGAGYDWVILDTSRDTINPLNNDLMADLSQVEGTANVYDVDFLANGFKLRSNYGTVNGSASYIFYAVAEVPFQYANAR